MPFFRSSRQTYLKKIPAATPALWRVLSLNI